RGARPSHNGRRELHSAAPQPYHARPPNCTATRDSRAMMFKICRDQAEMWPVQSFSTCIILPSPACRLAGGTFIKHDRDPFYATISDLRVPTTRSWMAERHVERVARALHRSLVEPQTR